MIDPMLATGGSAVAALDLLQRAPAPAASASICIVAAPEGVALVERHHPDVDDLHAGRRSRARTRRSSSFPGLGDFGDRLYGTV